MPDQGPTKTAALWKILSECSNITRSKKIASRREVTCKRICQTEGANKGNDYSQDLLSMGGSRGDIFIDFDFGLWNGIWHTTWQQKAMNINCKCLNFRQMLSKNYAIFWVVFSNDRGVGRGEDRPTRIQIFSQSVSLTQYVVLSVRLSACLPVRSS